MYCKHCGKKIPQESKFCQYCGKSIGGIDKSDAIKEEQVTENSFENVEYAGFWVRLGAYVIDFLGMMVVAFLIGVLIVYLFGENAVDSLPEIFWSYFSYVIYSTFALTVWSTTFGKHLYGLSVRTENSEPLSFGVALKRSFLQPLSTILFGIGYWNMGKNSKQQAWHDKSARTVVLRRKANYTFAYLVTFIAAIIWVYLSYAFQ